MGRDLAFGSLEGGKRGMGNAVRLLEELKCGGGLGSGREGSF